jgi:putative spermidine/putrescine transport system substrate-binding protein
MLARTLLAAVGVLAISLSAAAARDLTVVARGPAMLTAVQKVLIAPFTAATSIRAVGKSWTGDAEGLAATLKRPDTAWDVVAVDSRELAVGCAAGLFEKLDWSQIGGKDHYMPQAVSECGVGAMLSNLVLAWDHGKFSGSPSWADFWNVAKYPGKRGLRKGVIGNLEIALMADGVSPQNVYKVLSTSEGVDRAFRKLDQLKPYIVWWHSGDEAAHILTSGDVLMSSAPSDEIVQANRTTHRNFGIQWSDSLYDVLSWAIVKASPNIQPATQFLYFAGTSAVEARLGLFGDGGLAKGADGTLAPDELALSPTNPANLKSALQIDAGFWQESRTKLQQRFQAWLAH